MHKDYSVYSSIRGDCDECPEIYCTERNHHELAWFLCRNPNRPKHSARQNIGNIDNTEIKGYIKGEIKGETKNGRSSKYNCDLR
jgi:hypothetical protein